MSTCEKCWNDAGLAAQASSLLTQAEYYSILLKERKNTPCTPEQQAGVDAKTCPKCGRKTVSNHDHQCKNTNCR